MATSLQEISEVVWRQITGGGTDETAITLEEVIAAAKIEYAYQSLLMAWQNKRQDGEYFIDASLLDEKELTVKDNEVDISKLNILRSLPQDIWLQSIGGFDCKCKYVKSTVNLSKVLCDDDSLGDNARTFYIVGNKIKFPRGTHSNTLPIIYSTDGTDLDEGTPFVNEAIGAIVRQRLIEQYLGKIAPTDTTNNTSPTT